MSENEYSLKTREILYIFDSRDCSPNGERETGNEGPRIDTLTNRSLITDACFKRILRDYFMYLEKPGDKILVRQKLDYNETNHIDMDERLLLDVGVDEDKLKKMKSNELDELLMKTFIDYRLFGGMFFLSNQLIRKTGCVQFEHCLSLNIPSLIQTSITSSLASESGKGAGAFGSTTILDYAIFALHGVCNENLSLKTGASETDVTKLYEAMWLGLKSQNTRTKFQMMPRGLICIVPKDKRQRIPKLNKSIGLDTKEEKNFYDILLNFDNLFDLMKKYEEKIDRIEFHFDPDFEFTVSGQRYKNLDMALKESKILITTKELNLNLNL